MAERSRDWMAQAHRDLETARWNAEGEFHEWACFAAHQAADKTLKAVYAKVGGDAWGPFGDEPAGGPAREDRARR